MIKGINLEGLRVLGDPSDFVNLYYKQGADEICYLDNVATLYGTNNLSKFITRTAKNIFVPLTVGGGIKTLYDIENMQMLVQTKYQLILLVLRTLNLFTTHLDCLIFNNIYKY